MAWPIRSTGSSQRARQSTGRRTRPSTSEADNSPARGPAGGKLGGDQRSRAGEQNQFGLDAANQIWMPTWTRGHRPGEQGTATNQETASCRRERRWASGGHHRAKLKEDAATKQKRTLIYKRQRRQSCGGVIVPVWLTEAGRRRRHVKA